MLFQISCFCPFQLFLLLLSLRTVFPRQNFQSPAAFPPSFLLPIHIFSEKKELPIYVALSPPHLLLMLLLQSYFFLLNLPQRPAKRVNLIRCCKHAYARPDNSKVFLVVKIFMYERCAVVACAHSDVIIGIKNHSDI